VDVTSPRQFVPSKPGVYPENPGPTDRHRLAHDLYGSNDPEKLFNGAPATMAPWPTASRMKGEPVFDRERVSEALQAPVELHEFDPRNLHATQPRVLREHVAHYMEGDRYDLAGETSADKGDVGNQYPMVYRKGNGQDAIIAGHHRATTALLRGEPLRARVAYSSRRLPD
jgi:hypothetical protein